MAKRDRIGTHSVGGSPFFGNGFCETGHAGFGEGVVGLACVAVEARGRGDVDDGAGFAVFDAEEGRSRADEFEWLRVVQGEDRVPLLVGRLRKSRFEECLTVGWV